MTRPNEQRDLRFAELDALIGTKSTKAEVLRLLGQGIPQSRIASAVGVTKGRVSQIAVEAGTRSTNRGGRPKRAVDRVNDALVELDASRHSTKEVA